MNRNEVTASESATIDQWCREAAARYGVAPAVHEQDFIFQFLLGNPSFTDRRAAVGYYFDDGARSAEKLKGLISELRGSDTEGLELLEFASGYGCVTRHMRRVLPQVRVTSCDIHPEAATFIENEIGVTAIVSESMPEDLQLPNKYDVVFALSFFSHMPRTTWNRWLDRLLALLTPGGHMIFTTHGIESRRFLGFPEIPADGFWFRADSEQTDLDHAEYGLTITTPVYVFDVLQSRSAVARLVYFREPGWWSHQDLYVLRKTDPNQGE